MERLFDRMRWEGQAAAETGRSPTRLGLVESFDPDSFAVRVALQPDGTVTGWMPMTAPAVGQGFGIVAAPDIGDQVLVVFHEDDAECPVAVATLFHDGARPPVDFAGKAAPSGEYWLTHRSGAFWKLTNDGRLAGHSTVEIDLGNLTQAVVRLVREEFMALYNAHTHPTPAGQSGPPTQAMTAAHLTAVVKAN